MKPGVKTTEFWLSLLSMFVVGGFGVAPDVVSGTAAAGSAFVTGMYTLGRSIAKAFGR